MTSQYIDHQLVVELDWDDMMPDNIGLTHSKLMALPSLVEVIYKPYSLLKTTITVHFGGALSRHCKFIDDYTD